MDAKHLKSSKLDLLVSVIMPNYNYGNLMSRAIDSVLTQDYSNLELIIVDDGSTDNSRDVIESYRDKRIVKVYQSNQGVSSARNLGIKKARGAFVAFLDSDDLWHSEKLGQQLQAMISQGLDIVYCGVEVRNLTGTLTEIMEPKFDGAVYDLYIQFPGINYIILPTSSALIRRKIIGNQYFNVELSNAADWEFFARLSKFAKIGFISANLVVYRRHTQNMSTRSLSSFFNELLKAYRFLIKFDWKTTPRLSRILKYSLGFFSIFLMALKSYLKFTLLK